MKNKKLPKKTAEFYSLKNQLSNKNSLPKEISLYGMTPDQYNEGLKIHFKCFSQLMKIL